MLWPDFSGRGRACSAARAGKDAQRVANFIKEIEHLIRRERLWRLESVATARAMRSPRYEARRQHFRDLAHGALT